MTQHLYIAIRNSEPTDLTTVPLLPFDQFQERILQGIEAGGWLAALFGAKDANAELRVYTVIAHPQSGYLWLSSARLPDTFPSITPDCPQAHWFERELAEQWGVRPVGHPWLKPIRFHPSYRPGRDCWGRGEGSAILPSVTDFYYMEGEEVHEVAVGPVHAGIIEPGHFRFSCHGEKVYHLEISLGYQHRGIERALIGAPNNRTLHLMETIAGDTTIGHTLAYCQAVEALAGLNVSVRATILRAICLELERMANHTGDLGALAGDIGFLPTASYCGRLRGEFLNMTALLCGSRFGRGMVNPGGVRFDADFNRLHELSVRLEKTMRDLKVAVSLLWHNSSVMARFDETSVVTKADAMSLGLVGVAARASGVEHDVRSDFPTGIYSFANIPTATWHTGGVFARAFVRWIEIERSAAFLREHIKSLPESPLSGPCELSEAIPLPRHSDEGRNPAEVGRRGGLHLQPNQIVVSLIEGWRGAICHAAITGETGNFAHYKIIDPSFHNWMGLAIAMRDQQISDFPLCNKSFNLSYCGHDL